MKCIVISSFILMALTALAAKDERQLIKCLGEEEKKFHLKKETGPLYELNQRLISEMLQIPKAELSTESFNEICGPKVQSKSWKLLQLSLIKGNTIFEVPASVTGSQREMAKGMIDDYIESARELFLNVLTQIQSLSPSPTCLKEEIPQLEELFSDIKYLQEDVDMVKIIRGRDSKIFGQLQGYPQAFERCRARIKKKLKSESKAAAKKS